MFKFVIIIIISIIIHILYGVRKTLCDNEPSGAKLFMYKVFLFDCRTDYYSTVLCTLCWDNSRVVPGLGWPMGWVGLGCVVPGLGWPMRWVGWGEIFQISMGRVGLGRH